MTTTTRQTKHLLQRLREEFSITLRTLVCALLALLHATQTVQAVETVTYYHHDALGSPVAATDESGNLLWREDYKPYGERIRKPATDNKLWYTGKPEEPELGLQYFGARWYDPQLGRFTGIDPVDFNESNIHSFNRYAYANNNPYRFIDPDGRDAYDQMIYDMSGYDSKTVEMFSHVPPEKQEAVQQEMNRDHIGERNVKTAATIYTGMVLAPVAVMATPEVSGAIMLSETYMLSSKTAYAASVIMTNEARMLAREAYITAPVWGPPAAEFAEGFFVDGPYPASRFGAAGYISSEVYKDVSP